VADYVRYRPGYPPAVIDLLRREIGLAPSWAVADVGSGTGISAQMFLDNGNTVYAVEPNGPMREAAETLLGGRPNFHSVDGSAEDTTLTDRSVDLVVCAQAFHWFDPARSRAEFSRILRPGGHLVLLWNERKTAGSPLLEDYERLLLEYGTDYARVRHENVNADALDRFFGAGRYHSTQFRNEQTFDLTGLTGRLLSSSYTPAEGDPRRDDMLRALRAPFARYHSGGTVTIEYDTRVYRARL
jgi:SAM-dependent methyltransferase